MINFENDEILILEGRKHWFVAFTHIFGFFVAVIIPGIVLIILEKSTFFSETIRSGGSDITHIFYFLYLTEILFMWMILFINLTKYYLDVWYITSKKLIDIDQKFLFHRDEAVLRLENIQDVAIVSKGIIQTLLGFGTIRVQTSGEKREFMMKNIANPEKVKEIIVAGQGKAKDRVVSVKFDSENS